MTGWCCDLCENAAFLLDHGVHTDWLPHRLGAPVTTVEKRLRDHGHGAYAGRLPRAGSPKRAEQRRRQRAAAAAARAAQGRLGWPEQGAAPGAGTPEATCHNTTTRTGARP